MPTPALVIVGHGTRRSAGIEQFLQLVDSVARRLPAVCTRHAFLELVEPGVEARLDDLVRQGIQEVVVVPLLLLAAGHAKRDLPAQIERARARHPRLRVRQAAVLGDHPEILDGSARQFREAAARLQSDSGRPGADDGPLAARKDRTADEPRTVGKSGTLDQCGYTAASHSSGSDPAPTGDRSETVEGTGEDCLLLMVSRGSSDPDAHRQFERVARGRVELGTVGQLELAYLARARPTLDEAIERAIRSPLPRVVVQPHLLFAGEQSAILARRIGAVQQQERVRLRQQWIVAPTLGCSPCVVRAAIGRYYETCCATEG